MGGLGRTLILLGLVLVAAGLVVSYSSRIPWLGKLPGDFTFRSGGLTVYIPLATCLPAEPGAFTSVVSLSALNGAGSIIQ
jgi:hypothetical protein